MGAIIFIQVASAVGWGNASAIHSALHAVPGVKEVYFLTGPTDIIVHAEAANQAGLMDIIGKVRAVQGVGSTDTRVILPV
jgi:DNA-binding Lrp family transcriptional regulator